MASPPTTTLTKGNGASAVTVASGGTGYAVGDKITLAGGTAVVATVLQVSVVSSGAITGIFVSIPGVYTTNPTNAVAQGTTTGSGTGATFTMTYAGSAATAVAGGATLTATNAAFRFTGNGPTNISSSGYYGNNSGNGTACWWEWTTDAALFDVRLLGNNILGTIFCDGERISDTQITTDASGAAHVYTLDFSGVVVCRTFRLQTVNTAFGGIVIPSTASAWASPELRPPLAWGLGDSYTYGTNATLLAKAGFNTMCRLLGLDGLPDGVGGAGWLSTGSNDPATRVTNKLAALNRSVDYVFLDMGYNDGGGNMSTLTTNFTAAVAAIRASSTAASAKIIAFGPATPLGSTANLTTVKTTIFGLCTTLGLTFIDVDNWVNSTNKSIYTGGDNTHPTQAGYDYLAARRAQAVSPVLANA